MSNYFLRFAQLPFLYVLIPLILVIIFFRYYWHKPTVYTYSLGTTMQKHGVASYHPYKKIFFWLRAFVLLILALLIAKPQLVDSRSKVTIEGIDIVLVLDVSGSMQFQDYADDDRSRVDVAKQEAVRFIEKRSNDAIGLVIFGKDAVSRCPLTFDKHMLRSVVHELKIGTIDPDGTMLITAMVTAANRLKHSHAKSKVMIVLTDGEPSDGDMDPKVAVEVAKRLGIKMYTVGIGSEDDEVFMHPLFGLVAKPKVNKTLLMHIARETGGQFFMARNAQDMRRIYDTIDTLEKTEHAVPIFSKFYDIFMPFVGMLMGIMVLEVVLSTFIWFAI